MREELIGGVFDAASRREALGAELAAIREQLERERATPGRDVKWGRGGMMDVYFVTRYTQLRTRTDFPPELGTRALIEHLGRTGALDAGVAADLFDGYTLLRRIDHSTIFVFIAACYTPVGLLVLEGGIRWAVLITVWAGALVGVTFSVAWISAPRALCAALYIALGWVAVIAFPQLSSELSLIPLILIGAGGVLYTAGAVIFALGRPNPWPATFGCHEIFHVFVILAAVTHFVAMAGWIVMHDAA